MEAAALITKTTLYISYDQQDDYVYADWQGMQSAASIRQGCEEILAFVKKSGCARVLIDNTNLAHHNLDAETWLPPVRWIVSDWFPRLYGSGCMHFAWVHSPDRVNMLFPKETLRFKIRNPNIFIFDNKEMAASWLNREV